MKSLLILLVIGFFILSFYTFAQDSLAIGAKNNIINQAITATDSITSDTSNNKEVSVAGAVILSSVFPGSGLLLTRNYLPAVAYFTVTSTIYFMAFVVLDINPGKSFEDVLPIIIAGGLVHIISIVHTIKSTIKYNENITPTISYNGRNYQFGLSIRI